MESDTGTYTVEFFRYGALHYYSASSYRDTRRFIELYEDRLKEIRVVRVTANRRRTNTTT